MKKFTLVFLLLISLWGVSGYYAHGHVLGDLTHQYPAQIQEPWCTVWAYVGGPVSYFVEYAETGNRYWRTVPLTKEERWREFQRKFPELDRDYFEEKYN